MSFSYDPGQATDLDKVRFRIGDTSKPSLLEDEEIQAVLTERGDSVLHASVTCCERALMRASLEVNTTVSGQTVNREARVRQLQDGLRRLEDELMRTVAPFMGGISEAERQTQESDSDWKGPIIQSGDWMAGRIGSADTSED